LAKLVLFCACVSLLIGSLAFVNVNGRAAPDLSLEVKGGWIRDHRSQEEVRLDDLSIALVGIDTDHLAAGSPVYESLAGMVSEWSLMTQMFGTVAGTFYWALPTSFIGAKFIEATKLLDCWYWLLKNRDSQLETMGYVNFDKVDVKTRLPQEYGGRTVFNFGGSLHEKYRGKRMVSRVLSQILPQLIKLNQDYDLKIDTFLIETRTDNVPVNAIARKLGFRLLRTYTTEMKTPEFPVVGKLPLGSATKNQYVYDLGI
jgi:hypothetical protein